MLFFMAGLFVGALIGVFAISLLVAARDADSSSPQPEPWRCESSLDRCADSEAAHHDVD